MCTYIHIYWDNIRVSIGVVLGCIFLVASKLFSEACCCAGVCHVYFVLFQA